MPKATVSHETFKHDLKSVEGGWVELRQLSYYELMQRRDIASKMFTETKVMNKKKRREQSAEETLRAELDVMFVASMEFDFKNCIVAHNLEDDNGNLIDFSSSMAFKMLHPKVGQEINRLIEDLNEEDEDDLAPLSRSASSSSQGGSLSLETTNDPQ